MGILLNGIKPSKIIYNGAESSLYFNGSKIWPESSPVPLDEVQIGNQIWKTKNLAIDDGQGGITTKTVNYGQGDVVEYYYTWSAAVRIANSIPGWHLPTTDEWETLANTVGGLNIAGTKLKSAYGWVSGNGSDDYGFAVFPAGAKYSSSFYNIGDNADFWSATGEAWGSAYCWRFNTDAAMYSGNFSTIKYALPVRLVKDAA